mmetsp:Transcript_60952/g.144017  ORF Transcript_60952/g.144017 Transcript_60952/m.144017 type:complete len:127 (+) Transcript_60952:3-383(+)
MDDTTPPTKKRSRVTKPRRKTAPVKRNTAPVVKRDPVPALIDNENPTPGVRRSKRQRFRPLEFWRHERVVYDRGNQDIPEIVSVDIRSPDPTPFRTKRRRAAKVVESPSKTDAEGVIEGVGVVAEA